MCSIYGSAFSPTDADWLAGVDYEDKCEESADEDEEYKDNEEQDID